MREILSRHRIADMELIFHRGIDRKGNDCTGMLLIPAEMENQVLYEKEYDVEPLVQMKIIGDDYPFNYSQGRTMRGSQTGMKLHFVDQSVERDGEETRILTRLADSRGLECEHRICFYEGDLAFEVNACVKNHTGREIALEMVSSFTLGGLTPFCEGVAPETMVLHRIRSTWANEGRLVSVPVEEEQLEPSWKPSGANGIRFGQVGSMPNREYFPFVGIEDTRHGVCWGAQLAVASSWQLEAYRKDDALSISGGIADREMGQWIKKVADGESFVTPVARLSVVRGDVDQLCQRITASIDHHLDVAESERELPVLFNEFCTTWGKPTEEQTKRIVSLLAERNVRYYVIDAGWYKSTNAMAQTGEGGWNVTHGDWAVDETLFPHGMKALTDWIHEKGMKAGIWFEPENCGRGSEVFYKEELLAKRDGYPITAGHRRFLDLRKPEAREYLDQNMKDFLKDNGFDYVKIDYNANLGIGPDGEESLGAGLYDSVSETQKYFCHLKEEIPGLLIENCSAGGHRLTEPFLRISDMSSYSDAHECRNIPLVAGNMHRMIPIRQSQIWAVLHPEFSDALLYDKLTATFLGRMCLSGDVEHLSEHQWGIVDDAIAFYRQAVPVIADGTSRIMRKTGLSYKEPTGSQVIVRELKNEVLIVVHTFAESPETIELSAGAGFYFKKIVRVCAREGLEIRQDRQNPGQIEISGLADFDGIGILAEREPEKK
ncbi:glycoside hydrolase family 36 protein [Brotaphodocola sp.]|uniref:glycoside hydrolase family 36 protein n=1 Tax=Brotaphodocola sp. TaxID=3073577 RepID=UPI003D7E28A5